MVLKFYYVYESPEDGLIPCKDVKDLPIDLDKTKYAIVELGRNANENTDLVKKAKGDHWWFHLSDKKSGHVLIDNPTIDMNLFKLASELVVKYSKEKNNVNVKVDYCQRRGLTLTDTPGLVVYKIRPFSLII